mmetsp:Transcript_28437/g.72040  ORF Transcript_28437/g.72040 Transcript_28437/m.72040 type:complete len:299 (+) Transcript_28437:13-909(+)
MRTSCRHRARPTPAPALMRRVAPHSGSTSQTGLSPACPPSRLRVGAAALELPWPSRSPPLLSVFWRRRRPARALCVVAALVISVAASAAAAALIGVAVPLGSLLAPPFVNTLPLQGRSCRSKLGSGLDARRGPPQVAGEGGGSLHRSHWLQKVKRRFPKKPSAEIFRKNGISAVFMYIALGRLNEILMIVVLWPLFIMRNGASPILLKPVLTMNPKFLIYVTAVYFSYGSLMVPVMLAAAAALAPTFNRVLGMLQRRLGCSKGLAVGLLALASAVGGLGVLVGGIALACAVCRVPVLV